MRPPIALLTVLAATSSAIADDDPVADALGRPILGAHQPRDEVRAVVVAKLPPMPDSEDAAAWMRDAERLRRDAFERVLFRGEAAAWREAEGRVVRGDVLEGDGYVITKLRFEAIPGLWVPALLYTPDDVAGKVPVVLNVNGHDAEGKAADYKQVRCINQARRGMIALNVEWFGMGQLRGEGFHHGLINAVDLCGTSGIALHYLALSRALDVLLALEHADPERVAVTGLSGGGWQTIFFSGLDARVTLTDPVAGYSGFATRARYPSDLGDSEQTPCDLATVLDYTHLTALMAPRPTLLTFNAEDDCCFAAPHALPPLWRAARPVFALFGKEDRLRSQVNFEPGTHNYGLDNRQALYRMLGDHFFPGDPGYDARETPCDDEVRAAEELEVELPDENLDFHQVAECLAAELPRGAGRPVTREEAATWQASRRDRLRSIVRPPGGVLAVREVRDDATGDLRAAAYTMPVGGLSVPFVALSRGEPAGTTILLADAGRAEAAEQARALLDDGRRVVALDPYSFGEAAVEDHAYLYALFLGAVGERPLGIQAEQVRRVARWARDRHGEPVEIVAVGPRTGVVALTAAAIEPEAIGGVALHAPIASLKAIIEEGRPFERSPELFCFGLLEHFDVADLAALVAPRPVRLHDADEQAHRTFAALASWYELLGGPAEPAP